MSNNDTTLIHWRFKNRTVLTFHIAKIKLCFLINRFEGKSKVCTHCLLHLVVLGLNLVGSSVETDGERFKTCLISSLKMSSLWSFGPQAMPLKCSQHVVSHKMSDNLFRHKLFSLRQLFTFVPLSSSSSVSFIVIVTIVKRSLLPSSTPSSKSVLIFLHFINVAEALKNGHSL